MLSIFHLWLAEDVLSNILHILYNMPHDFTRKFWKVREKNVHDFASSKFTPIIKWRETYPII